jgi:GT2 family glycosyltransferase
LYIYIVKTVLTVLIHRCLAMSGTEKRPFISIIIVNYNGLRWLYDCLNAVFSQSYSNFEVIVVDNASGDGSAEFIRSHFGSVKLKQLDSNYGYAAANNIGLKFAQGEFIVFLNNDTKVLDNWLESLVDTYIHNVSYKILASIQLPDQEPNKTRDIMAYFGPSVYSSETNGRNIIDSVFASGASFITSKGWIGEVGYLFDENYFMVGEDFDLSFRTILLGGKIGYVKNSRLFHFTGGSSGEIKPRIAVLGVRNRVLTAYKIFNNKYFAKAVFASLLYAVLRTLVKPKELTINLAMFKGLLYGLAYTGWYSSYRKEFRKRKRVSDIDLVSQFKYKTRFQKVLYTVLWGRK